jgi:hypothetical protein
VLLALALGCPIKVEKLNKNSTKISAPGGIDFKVEPKWVKLRIQGAFDSADWTYARLGKGAALIDGFYAEREGLEPVAQLAAHQDEKGVNWFISVKLNRSGQKDRWVTAGAIDNKFYCNFASKSESRIDSVSMDKIGEMNRARLVIPAPVNVYRRMGL